MAVCLTPNKIIKRPFQKWEFYTYKNYIQKGKPAGSIILEIPCGHCKNCLKNKSLEYFNRNLMEYNEAKSSYFLTLTYNNDNIKGQHTIKELQEFIHKLQDFYWNNYKIKGIRYFGVSEYGDNSNRYHFHILIYNIPIKNEDFKKYKITTPKKIKWINKQVQQNYFTNNQIAKIWNKGIIAIAPINEARINYLVSYLFKSLNKNDKKTKEKLKKLGLEAPTKIQSDNLGYNFIAKNINNFLIHNQTYIKGKIIYANKYIDQKAKIESEERTNQRILRRIEKVGLKDPKTEKINNRKGYL